MDGDSSLSMLGTVWCGDLGPDRNVQSAAGFIEAGETPSVS